MDSDSQGNKSQGHAYGDFRDGYNFETVFVEFRILVHFKLLRRFFRQSRITLTWLTGPGFGYPHRGFAFLKFIDLLKFQIANLKKFTLLNNASH